MTNAQEKPQPQPTKISLTALISANVAASKEEARYYLNGVYTHVEGGKRVYVATDGHIMVIIKEDMAESDNGDAMIIPSDAIEMAKKLYKDDLKKGFDVFLTDKGFKGYSQEMTFTPIDGTFPDYKRVFPASEGPVDVIGIDGELAGKLTKSQKLYNGQRALKMTFMNQSGPIHINNGKDWSALLMPIRV